MISQLKLTKLLTLFATVIALFCTLQAPASASDIDMYCDDIAVITLEASDSQGASWFNDCGYPVEVIIDYASGLWNYGSAEPYRDLVDANGNPDGPVYGNFANPDCYGAELSYLIDDEPVPDGCYEITRYVLLEPYQMLTLIDNDARGDAYYDNEGEQEIVIRNFQAY